MRFAAIFSKRTAGFLIATLALAACGDSLRDDQPLASDGTAFAWDPQAFEAYAFTYTQPCGLQFAATEPTSVWVEQLADPVNLGDRSQPVPSIPELLEVLSNVSDEFEVTEFSEGEFGQPERITIERSGDGRPLFCFELIDFDGSSRNDEMRLSVPAVSDFEIANDGRTIVVGVPSCNGEPTVTFIESEESITFQIETQVPTGSNGDECADEVALNLESPLGNRMVIDDFGGRILEQA